MRISAAVATILAAAACSSTVGPRPAASPTAVARAPAAPNAEGPGPAGAAPTADAAPPRDLAYPPLPFVATRKPRLGKAKLVVTPCRLDVPIAPTTVREPDAGGLAIDAAGRVYVLFADGTVRRFHLDDPCDLHVDPSFSAIKVPANDHVDGLSVDCDDVLYVARFNQKTLAIAPDGTRTEICGSGDVVRTDPGAAATIVEGRRVTKLDAACAGPEIKLEGWRGDIPEDATWPFGDGFAFVDTNGSQNASDDYLRVEIHTLDGKQKVRVGTRKGGPQQICAVAAVWQCGTGICVADHGCSSLRVWKANGRFVGAVASPQLVGQRDARQIDAVSVGDASLMLVGAALWHDDTHHDDYPLIVRIDGLAAATR